MIRATDRPIPAIASSPFEPADQSPAEQSPAESSRHSTPRPHGPLARLLIGAIRTYQLARIGRVSPCRFTPTCSHYAVEAVNLHGTRKGLALTARRLGRCRPGGPYGFDPVPEHPLSRTVRDQ